MQQREEEGMQWEERQQEEQREGCKRWWSRCSPQRTPDKQLSPPLLRLGSGGQGGLEASVNVQAVQI